MLMIRKVLWIFYKNLKTPFFSSQLFPFKKNHIVPMKKVVTKFIPSVISIYSLAKSSSLWVSQTNIN